MDAAPGVTQQSQLQGKASPELAVEDHDGEADADATTCAAPTQRFKQQQYTTPQGEQQQQGLVWVRAVMA